MVKKKDILEPESKQVITKEEREMYFDARYKVETIIPLVEKPERRIYTFTQEGLDMFLEGYLEYAEFLVKIEKIEN